MICVSLVVPQISSFGVIAITGSIPADVYAAFIRRDQVKSPRGAFVVFITEVVAGGLDSLCDAPVDQVIQVSADVFEVNVFATILLVEHLIDTVVGVEDEFFVAFAFDLDDKFPYERGEGNFGVRKRHVVTPKPRIMKTSSKRSGLRAKRQAHGASIRSSCRLFLENSRMSGVWRINRLCSVGVNIDDAMCCTLL